MQSQKGVAAFNAQQRVDEAYQYVIASGDPNPNLAAIARQFEASYPTLRRRVQGRTKPRSEAHESQQHLSNSKEKALVDWLNHLSDIGRPVSRRTIVRKVQVVCGLPRRPSRKWLQGFLARNPNLRMGKPSGLDPKRAQAFNEATVERHFELLRRVLEEHGIPWSHVYNMDEKGVQRGGGRKANSLRFIIPRNRRPHYKIRSPNLELVTIIECVCADGESLLPGFVFAGKEFHKEWFDVHPDIFVGMSPNGWTDDQLCFEWFKQSFIPQTAARRESDAPILLICDGHGSHITSQMVDFALQHDIHIICLPPHTTHKLQPLDVGVFGPLQRAWSDHCDDVVEATKEEIPRKNLVYEYMAVRNQAVHPDLVRSAWKRCGMAPLNPDIFTDVDFCPSHPSSTSAHLPPSYPTPSEASMVPPSNPDVVEPIPDGDLEMGGRTGGDESDKEWEYPTDDELVDEDMDLRTEPHPVVTAIRRPQSPSPSLAATDLPAPPRKRPRSSTVHQSRSQDPKLPSKAESLEAIGFNSRFTASKRIEALMQLVVDLKADKQDLQGQLEASLLHCEMAKGELEESQRQLNAKAEQSGTKTRTLVTDSRCFTSGSGLVEWRAQEDTRRAKQKEKDDAQDRRAAQETADDERRRKQTETKEAFTGSLASKNKSGLQDVAYALGLPITGTKSALLDAIHSHFNTHPLKKAESRFRELFERGQKRSAAVAFDGDDQQPVAGSSHDGQRAGFPCPPFVGPEPHHPGNPMPYYPFPHIPVPYSHLPNNGVLPPSSYYGQSVPNSTYNPYSFPYHNPSDLPRFPYSFPPDDRSDAL